MFSPKYAITRKMVADLMKIQESQTLVELLPLPVTVLSELQKESKEKTVVLSTRMEGNTLSEAQAKDAMYIHHDNVEKQEVFNLTRALLVLDEWEARELPITEERVKELHAIIQVTHGSGRRPQRNEYRTGQNQVGSRNASHFYLPPEARDVPSLMEDLIAWVNSPNQLSIVAPIKAGIFMYQFLTIHPYYDGNGRTARMFATYILRRESFGLKKLFVLESHYDRNLQAYYANLQLGLSHNYYFGRNDTDITKWLEFFIGGMAEAFQDASNIVRSKSEEYTSLEPVLLRGLDAEQRAVFGMLTFKWNWMSTTVLARLLNISDRTLRTRIKSWIESGFLAPRDGNAQRIRSITLSDKYRELAEEVQNEPDKYRYLLY